MKHIESLLSFVVAVVGLLLPRRGRRKKEGSNPCCGCPYMEGAICRIQ